MHFVKKADLKNIQPCDRMVKDFQGKACKSLGKVRTQIQLGKVFYTSDFIIFDGDYKTDIILGMPFLNSYGLGDILRETISNSTGPRVVHAGEPKNE